MPPIGKDAERRRERQYDQYCSEISANWHGPVSGFSKNAARPAVPAGRKRRPRLLQLVPKRISLAHERHQQLAARLFTHPPTPTTTRRGPGVAKTGLTVAESGP